MSTNPRRFRSNRPNRGGTRATGGGGGYGGRPRRRGGGGGRGQADLPMLLGEPSPSLAKINEMNMAKLTIKIASLAEEEKQLTTRLQRLNEVDPPPADKIKTVTELLKRLVALKTAAEERLAGKAARKAAREQGMR